jgi:hypothetical protein
MLRPLTLVRTDLTTHYVREGERWYYVMDNGEVWEAPAEQGQPWAEVFLAVVLYRPPLRTDDRSAPGSSCSARGSPEPWQPNEPRYVTPQHVTPQPRPTISREQNRLLSSLQLEPPCRRPSSGGRRRGRTRRIPDGENNSSSAGSQPAPAPVGETAPAAAGPKAMVYVPRWKKNRAPEQPDQEPPPNAKRERLALDMFARREQAFLDFMLHPMNREDPQEPLTLAYFRAFPCASRRVNRRKVHNEVLKSTADKAVGLWPDDENYQILLPNNKPFVYGAVKHLTGTPKVAKNYTVDFSVLEAWSWIEMLSAIDDTESRTNGQTDLERVFGQAHSIKEMRIEYDRNSSGRNRPERLPNERNGMVAWNYVVIRDDETFCKLHPDLLTCRIYYAEGFTKRDGSGSYEFNTGKLRFNPKFFSK